VLLSFDVSMLAMFNCLDVKTSRPLRIPCCCGLYCGRFSNIKGSEYWKFIAALNILLFAEKLQDNIIDDNSFFSKVLLIIFNQSITKAGKDFPYAKIQISKGYNRILELEKIQSNAETIATAFSEMICSAISDTLDISAQQRKFFRAVCSWVYIIDAVDDRDKDIKHGKFNPFTNSFNPETVRTIINQLTDSCLTYDDNDFDYRSAEIILNKFIPDVTEKILCKKSLRLAQFISKTSVLLDLVLHRKIDYND
jgi:hypothetical protein